MTNSRQACSETCSIWVSRRIPFFPWYYMDGLPHHRYKDVACFGGDGHGVLGIETEQGGQLLLFTSQVLLLDRASLALGDLPIASGFGLVAQADGD